LSIYRNLIGITISLDKPWRTGLKEATSDFDGADREAEIAHGCALPGGSLTR